MGILNVTPDSFSDGGRFLDPGRAAEQGVRLAEEGADLIDVGGASTRPGALPVPLAEELRRVLPVVARLAKTVRVPISVDTAQAEVARQALDRGAALINDVTALRGDPAMAGVIARSKAAVILMHMHGTPQTMQRAPRYQNVVRDVADFLRAAARRAEAAGIERARILIDPGLGFGKTTAHNLQLMAGLPTFVRLEWPVVLGPSRKSFIGQTLDLTDPQQRLAGTLACVAEAYRAGVRMVRVHEVQPTRQLITMLAAIRRASLE